MVEGLLQSALSGLASEARERHEFRETWPSAPRSLGEYAMLARALDQIISVPWREVGRRVTGSPGTPLHANAFGGFATRENIHRSQSVFRVQPIASRAAQRLGMRGLAIQWVTAASVGPGASRSWRTANPSLDWPRPSS
jgi:hypothetical protein